MYKKIISVLMSALIVFSFASCSSENKSEQKLSVSKSEQKSNNTSAYNKPETTETTTAPISADLDLSAMNFNLLYSQINEMKTSPEKYLGKTVKISGTYQISHYDQTGKDYYYVVGGDATACCNWSMEFILPDGMAYPEVGSQITLVGTYDTYDELDVTYYYINVTSVE